MGKILTVGQDSHPHWQNNNNNNNIYLNTIEEILKNYSGADVVMYLKVNIHPTFRCKYVEQCHIWDDKTRAAYRFA